MANERYYRVDVTDGRTTGPAYFYETTEGRADLQFGWANNTTGMSTTVAAAVEDFHRTLQARHNTAGDGIVVAVSQPVEVTREEVVRHNPIWGAMVQSAKSILREEMKRSVYPVGITAVDWEWIDDTTSPALVRLRLSDDLGTVAAEFTPQELKDESLMRPRLGRLYDELIDLRLEKFLERNLESIREHESA